MGDYVRPIRNVGGRGSPGGQPTGNEPCVSLDQVQKSEGTPVSPANGPPTMYGRLNYAMARGGERY